MTNSDFPVEPRSETTDSAHSSPGSFPANVDAKWRTHYEHLVQERDRLINTVQDLQSKSLDEGPNPLQEGMAAAGTDSDQRDRNLDAVSADQDTLVEIEAAFVRLSDGTYGVCEITGQPISEERLQAVPWARYTIEVQQRIEREAAR